MRAYSHSDLADKHPKAAFDKLSDPHTIDATLRFQEERVSDLDGKVYSLAQTEE